VYKMSAPQLPDKAVLGPGFEIGNDPSLSFFFDDDRGNVIDVQSVANANDWNLQSVLCLPTQMTLYGLGLDLDGAPRIFDCAQKQAKDEYYQLKKDATSIAKDINVPHGIGTGITREIIQKIIAKETEPEPKRTGLYFFDFDMLLSQFNGLDFPIIDVLPTQEWFEQYAKYLFSDTIDEEPEDGRLTLLKRMFQVIGPERIYIITANPYAGADFTLGTGRVVPWFVDKFIGLLQVLLPSFIPTHLVYANTKVQSKSTKIMQILESRPKGGARLKTRKTKRTKSKVRKTRSRTRSKTSRRSRCSRKKSRRLS